MIRYKNEVEQKIFRHLNANPMFHSKDNVSVHHHVNEPRYLSLSVDIYFPLEYGEGENAVMLRKILKNEIPEFVKLFDLKGRDDMREIKKSQLWNYFLSGECDLVCIVKDCVYTFELIGGADGNELEFWGGDIEFAPQVLPRNKFKNIHGYWEYAWNYHHKNLAISNDMLDHPISGGLKLSQ